MSDPQIVYKTGVVFYGGNSRMPAWAEERLKGYMSDSDVDVLQISSGYRYPADQARIMLDNIRAHGLQSQYDLYGNNGDRVLDAYAQNAGASDSTIINAMVAAINRIGPEKISRHMATDAVVADIAPSSITGGVDGSRFATLKMRMQAAPQDVNWRQDPGTLYEVGELIWPPKDPALHFEFPNNSSVLLPSGPGLISTTNKVITAAKGGALLFLGYKVVTELVRRR